MTFKHLLTFKQHSLDLAFGTYSSLWLVMTDSWINCLGAHLFLTRIICLIVGLTLALLLYLYADIYVNQMLSDIPS